jgi:hypothetical protein
LGCWALLLAVLLLLLCELGERVIMELCGWESTETMYEVMLNELANLGQSDCQITTHT